MESNSSGIFPKNINLFEDEEASLENLIILLSTPVGFNSVKDIDPWDPSLMEIKNGNVFPEWYYKYFENYNDIDRLIILVQRNNYLRSQRNKQNESVNISAAFTVNLNHNLQI